MCSTETDSELKICVLRSSLEGSSNVIFDILEDPAFTKYSKCWVSQRFEKNWTIFKKLVPAYVAERHHICQQQIITLPHLWGLRIYAKKGKSRQFFAICVSLSKFCSLFALFVEKFTQVIFLCDCRLRQIWCLAGRCNSWWHHV